MAAEKLKLSFRTVGKERAPLYHVCGAMGGPMADGCVMMWAFVESNALTPVQNGEVDTQTGKMKLGPLVSKTTANGVEIDRDFQCGLVMTTEKARLIGNWLIAQADSAEKAFETAGSRKATEEA